MRTSVLAAFGAAMLSGSAFATTVTTSAQFGPGPTDYNGAGAGASVLDFFNISLGTLNSVSITASYGFTSTVTVTNSAQSSSVGNVRVESAAGFRSTSSAIDDVFRSQVDQLGPVTIGITTVDPAAFDLLGRTQSYALAPGASQTLTSNAATQSFGTGPLTATTVLSAFSYAGVNIFFAQLQTVTGTLLSNSGGSTGAYQQTNATGTLQVVYDYTPGVTTGAVPEPAIWAMMVGGFGLVGATMRRREVKVDPA